MIFISLLILGIALGWFPWYVLALEFILGPFDFIITVSIIGGIIYLFD
jgi:hypothetical protein